MTTSACTPVSRQLHTALCGSTDIYASDRLYQAYLSHLLMMITETRIGARKRPSSGNGRKGRPAKSRRADPLPGGSGEDRRKRRNVP